jgi:hypothetical protein
MTHPIYNPAGSWPRLMRAETAAAYLDEKSVEAFRRGVGTIYPRPIKVTGKGDRWLRDDLDAAIEKTDKPSKLGPRRERRVVKPVGWPRYLREKRLKSGDIAYWHGCMAVRLLP